MIFADGSVKNEIVFNNAMDIITGQYKVPGTMNVFWFTEPECINKVNVSKNGIPSIQLTEDIDLYARPVTFILKSGSNFNKLISDNINEIRFTDIEMPDDAIAIVLMMTGIMALLHGMIIILCMYLHRLKESI